MCWASDEALLLLAQFEDIISIPYIHNLFLKTGSNKGFGQFRSEVDLLHAIVAVQHCAHFSHKLAHKVENVPNPVQSYDIWSVA